MASISKLVWIIAKFGEHVLDEDWISESPLCDSIWNNENGKTMKEAQS